MGISDKTRKILWAKSGNRCAICKQLLSEQSSTSRSDSLIGDECHIVAQSKDGPRGNINENIEIDGLDNLILLCKNHHKSIDDEPNTYTIAELTHIKTTHENWVKNTLSGTSLPKLRILKDPEEKNLQLKLILSGKTLLESVQGSSAGSFTNDELHSEAEAELVGGFLQNIRDYIDIYEDMDITSREKLKVEITEMIGSLLVAGFAPYIAQLNRKLVSDTEATPFPVCVVHVFRMLDKSQELSS
jgi:hypothetical protein